MGKKPSRSGRRGSDSEYLHGTSPREQHRLSLLNDLVNEGSLRELGLKGGEKILEMGSGLGQLARRMARQAGKKGGVLGIERSREQIDSALHLAEEEGDAGRVEFRQGDALEPPLRDDEWGSFDVAHARFLLEHLPDPLRAVRILVDAVRPGGRVVLEDDDHAVLRLWPDPPGFGSLWTAYQRSFDRLGNDPFVGRRLVALLHQAGAVPSRNTWIFFGSCSGHRQFPGFVENILRVVQGAKETVVTQELLDPASFDLALESLEAWGKRPDAAFWFAVCWAEALKPR
jgi:SAM-dependent methyltransferase